MSLNISSGSVHDNLGLANPMAASNTQGAPHKKQKWEEQCEICVPPDALMGDAGAEASDAEYYSAVIWTTVLGTLVNVALTVIKLLAGIAYGSSGLLADSIHSLSDVVSDGVTIFAARYSSAPADARFPYGYGKWEGLATMWISVCLVGGAGGMMWHFGEKMFPALAAYFGSSGENEEPVSLMSVHAISVAVASILLKELAFRLTISVGNRLKSQVLIANAWHHRSDALSSIAALAGVLGAVFGRGGRTNRNPDTLQSHVQPPFDARSFPAPTRARESPV